MIDKYLQQNEQNFKDKEHKDKKQKKSLQKMNTKKCYCCQRSSHSLLTVNCGHRSCFLCIRNTRSGHKCKKCNQKTSQNISPIKNKSSQKSSQLQSQQTRHGVSHSPIIQTQRINPITSRINTDHKLGDALICPDHKQPLNMFCKRTKQILCSVCLCKKTKYNQQILPLKNAQQFIKKQNKLFRQQAKIAQTDVQNAWKIVNKNRQIFQLTIQSHSLMINAFYDKLVTNLRQMQQNSIKLCRDYLNAKIIQYGQISDDLNYLTQTLKQFRQSSKDTNSINQMVYYYTSYHVIKKTLQTLSFQYIPYQKKQIILIQLDEQLSQRVQRQLIKFRFNIQIKQNQKNKARSSSIKSIKKKISPDNIIHNKYKISDNNINNNIIKKHKFSLCSNGSIDYDNQDTNLYKKLLKVKYKL